MESGWFASVPSGGVDGADDGACVEVHELEACGFVDEDGVGCAVVLEDIHAPGVDELAVVDSGLADDACGSECGAACVVRVTACRDRDGERREQRVCEGVMCGAGLDHVCGLRLNSIIYGYRGGLVQLLVVKNGNLV